MTAERPAPGTVPISGRVVRAARQRASLTTEQLSDLLKKHLPKGSRELYPSDVVGWERADRAMLTIAEAEALADACVVRYADLFRNELPPEPYRDYRRIAGAAVTTSRRTRSRLDMFDRFYELQRRLSAELGGSESVSLPSVPLSELDAHPEIVVQNLRETLGVTREVQASWESPAIAVDEWRERIEGLGVSVFSIGVDVGDLRGAALWLPGGPPAVLVNSADDATAQCFTLMHELAHLISRAGDRGALCDPSATQNNRTEQTANRFAAEMLVPGNWLQEITSTLSSDLKMLDYRTWPVGIRRELASTFNVSNAVVGIRLADLALAAESGYRPFWRATGGQPRGRSTPRWQRFRKSLGARTASRMREAIEREVLSPAEVARLLSLKASEVEQITAA